MNYLKQLIENPKSLLIIFTAVASIIIIAVVGELYQSRKEVLDLMQSQSHSLLETIMISSEEVIIASEEVENEINNRLLNNAALVNILYSSNQINDQMLVQIAKTNKINRINVFSNEGKLVYSNFASRRDTIGQESVKRILEPIFNNEKDTVIIGVKQARKAPGYRYVVALATFNRGAVVLNLDAEELMEFRKRMGFGILLNRLTENEGVKYTAIQDSMGIIAASSNVADLENINQSEFLTTALHNNLFYWRFHYFGEEEIYEAVHPFNIEGSTIGIFRLGLSLEPLNSVYQRSTMRIIISALFLMILGTILMGFLFARQNLSAVKKQYNYIESFSNQLIQNVKDVIIVFDDTNKIKVINNAGLTFFNTTREESVNLSLQNLLCEEAENNIRKYESTMFEIPCTINGVQKNLLLSRSEFKDSDENINHVLIIKDLTEIKNLEKQLARSEQINAMGHLASGVAHEIRNPLNTIGTIAQQLDQDYDSVDDKANYHSLTKLIYSEVRRINRAIENFLKFARPEKIIRSPFELHTLIEELELQYKSLLKSSNVELVVSENWKGKVNWDKDKIRQVLMNLIENAKDAIDENGKIVVSVREVKEDIILTVEDNGSGIEEENLNRIFNLYYTTKAKGTGVGLSIIQRIINEHEGIITVESKLNVGTKFIITIKSNINENM